MDYGKYNNSISVLEGITDRQYESIFKMYQAGEYYFYNILQCIHLPDNITSSMYMTIRVEGIMPLTTLSYEVYGDIKLWWLICLANKIDNPTQFIKPGTQVKLIKPASVNKVIKAIQTHINGL